MQTKLLQNKTKVSWSDLCTSTSDNNLRLRDTETPSWCRHWCSGSPGPRIPGPADRARPRGCHDGTPTSPSRVTMTSSCHARSRGWCWPPPLSVWPWSISRMWTRTRSNWSMTWWGLSGLVTSVRSLTTLTGVRRTDCLAAGQLTATSRRFKEMQLFQVFVRF